MAICDWKTLHQDHFHGVGALVTGGAGFIGSHLTEALIDLGADVIVLDDLSGGDEGNFDNFREKAGKRLRFIKGSILDRPLLTEAMRGREYVFHLAALGSVPGSVGDPARYHDVNTNGTAAVLEAARARARGARGARCGRGARAWPSRGGLRRDPRR